MDMIDKLTLPFSELLKKNRSFRNGFLLFILIIFAALALCIAVGEIYPKATLGYAFLIGFGESRGWSESTFRIVWILIKGSVVLLIILLSPLFLVWWERKIAAHMQSRYGPMRVGGWHGWLQTLADGIKLLLKEDIVPQAANPLLHRLAPIIVFIPAFLAFAPLPFGEELAAVNLDIGLIYILGVSGLSVFGLIMAGWASGNKFSLLGGLRAAAQMVSFELPRAVSLVPVIMFAGSLSLVQISHAQAGTHLGFIPKWNIFMPFVGQIGFLIYLISSIAETNRTPFDLPEAESELVAGFHTEYTGIKFSLFLLGEYAFMLLACALGAVVFLGGWNPVPGLEFIPSWAWFFLKTGGLVFVFLWVRWTFPRFRIDRMMDFNWKVLLPWAFVNVGLAGLIILLKG